ncbi:Phosphoribosyl 1,2-cyclic phosphodiesterase [Rubritalea squalenifaciens DSM 18772]|uniref:Phosphoribosyl 1,2-cyclic phosphodiesterase n=2 Tax=Rubritalea squalenifaciens TaxID=407226 RepID=A0A1M6RY03_9BACT|nr:Phosphoribosyl 1,2-cyclic phosphodiesterase [Rubritalea squalenifaciens DSM 18772]
MGRVRMRMAVLGSGSGGNATILESGNTRILIDAGLSAKQIVLRLEMLGVDPDSLTGLVLTHEHSDHARGVDVFLRKRRIPLFANAMTKEALEWNLKSDIEWKVFQTGQGFQLGGLHVHPFPIPHDAAEPVGFVVEQGGTRFGLVTDVGYITQAMRSHLKGSHAIFVESNYDEDMLEADTKRPWSTKQRIASRHGHLSNTQAGELLADVGCGLLQGVVLGHLSGDCNCPDLATKTVQGLLDHGGLDHVKVLCAQQDAPTEWLEFGTESKPGVALDGDLIQTELF